MFVELEHVQLEEDEAMEEFADGVVSANCEHGCMVEPDGECPHGGKSWMREMGVI